MYARHPFARLAAVGCAVLVGAAVVVGYAVSNAAVANAASLPPVATGDTRNVTEPSLPTTTCATLGAGLTMANRKSGSTQEQIPPDTGRIQSALNGCSQSASTPVAVKLVASGVHGPEAPHPSSPTSSSTGCAPRVRCPVGRT